MTPRGEQQLDLARRLIATIEDQVATRTTSLSGGAIRELPVLVKYARQQLLDDGDPRLIDAEAACAVEMLIALTYARAEKNRDREDRVVMFLNCLLTFMRTDLAAAERAAGIPPRGVRQ